MKCHAYCILPDRDGLRTVLPPGPDGVSLALVVEDALACIYAPVSDTLLTPAVSDLLDYARVVDTLARHFPLLPMRYGSVLDSEDELRDLLRKRHVDFQACLERLDGCGEMSIRVLPEPGGDPPGLSLDSESRLSSGSAYLALRRAKYQASEHARLQSIRLCDEVLDQFQGLFRASRTEKSTVTGRFLVSLHFLVSKDHVETFRARFQRFHQTTSLKVLLSGPWPPYNFAVGD